MAPIVWDLMRPRKKLLALGFLLMAINRVSGLVLPYSTRYLIDSVIAKHHVALLKPIVLAVLGATVIQGITSFSLTQLLSKAAQRLITELREKGAEAHLAPAGFFLRREQNRQPGFAHHERRRRRAESAGHGIGRVGGGLLTSLIALVVLFRISALMTVLAFGALACFAIALNRAFSTIRPIFRERGKINAEVTGRLAESLGGVRVIKGYHAEEREEAVFAGGVRRLLENVMRTLTATSSDESLGQPADGRCGRRHHVCRRAPDSRGHAHGGRVLHLHALPGIPGCAHHPDGGDRHADHRGLRRAGAHAGDSARTAGRSGSEAHRDAHRHCWSAWNLKTSASATTATGVVLHDVSFLAEPGTVTALVGSSGSGKSTTIGLISAFHVPTEGRVTIDDIDLSTVRLDSYRTRLGVVLQESFLFDGTIRENVAFSRPDASEEEIMRACRIARVDEFAESFEEKYDTIVGERGVKLSGGQRQRISIARAILAEPRILILDEATSSLDSESEQMIQHGLSYLMQGRTTFVIAHRLSTIRRADQILVMEQGRIVERGTHEELYELRGRYYDLYTKQHGLETNLFLAPGEGDTVVENGNGASSKEPVDPDALRVIRGEVR